MSADAAIGELDLDGHAGDGGGHAMQWLPGGVADQRKAPREHAAIGERREQLPVALAAREPRGDERTDCTLGALRKYNDTLALARDPRAIGLDIRRHAGAQPVRDAGIALAPARLRHDRAAAAAAPRPRRRRAARGPPSAARCGAPPDCAASTPARAAPANRYRPEDRRAPAPPSRPPPSASARGGRKRNRSKSRRSRDRPRRSAESCWRPPHAPRSLR